MIANFTPVLGSLLISSCIVIFYISVLDYYDSQRMIEELLRTVEISKKINLVFEFLFTGYLICFFMEENVIANLFNFLIFFLAFHFFNKCCNNSTIIKKILNLTDCMTKEVIFKFIDVKPIPNHVVSRLKSLKDNECCICFENISETDFKILNCGHYYHSECVQDLNKCPICRINI